MCCQLLGHWPKARPPFHQGQEFVEDHNRQVSNLLTRPAIATRCRVFGFLSPDHQLGSRGKPHVILRKRFPPSLTVTQGLQFTEPRNGLRTVPNLFPEISYLVKTVRDRRSNLIMGTEDLRDTRIHKTFEPVGGVAPSLFVFAQGLKKGYIYIYIHIAYPVLTPWE